MTEAEAGKTRVRLGLSDLLDSGYAWAYIQPICRLESNVLDGDFLRSILLYHSDELGGGLVDDKNSSANFSGGGPDDGDSKEVSLSYRTHLIRVSKPFLGSSSQWHQYSSPVRFTTT